MNIKQLQTGKPFSFAGQFYKREGASSQKLTRSDIKKFSYKERVIHYDGISCDGFDLKSHKPSYEQPQENSS